MCGQLVVLQSAETEGGIPGELDGHLGPSVGGPHLQPLSSGVSAGRTPHAAFCTLVLSHGHDQASLQAAGGRCCCVSLLSSVIYVDNVAFL